MAISYDLEIATPLPLNEVARELLEVARPLDVFDATTTSDQLVEDGRATRFHTWIRVYEHRPQPWSPVITDLGITPTVGAVFRLQGDTTSEQLDDVIRMASGLLERIPGDALLSGLEVIWLVRRNGDLTLNERDDIWTPLRLAAIHLPYRRVTHAYEDN
jgi:hypothetical protein